MPQPLPNYERDGKMVCGLHGVELIDYFAPANWQFSKPAEALLEASSAFPNAKLWGEVDEKTAHADLDYCPQCQLLLDEWQTEQQRTAES